MRRVNKKGFTVIEVSLVLAIAGLIFLMVFIALPSLQRTQRDTTRRDDMLVFLRRVKDYQTNNRGTLPIASSDTINITWGTDTDGEAVAPSSWAGFFRDYMGEKFVDPDGTHYNLTVVKCGASAVDADCVADAATNLEDNNFPNGYKLIVVTQATCYGNKAVGVANPRKIAVMYRLEGSGSYCANT